MRPEPPEPSKLPKQTRPTATAHWRHLDPSGGGAVHCLAGRELLSSPSGVARILDVLTMAR
jgi:hypothetical protein